MSESIIVGKSGGENKKLERIEKIKSLKRRIVGIYGSSLLTTPLDSKTVHKIFKEDTAAEKARKKAENAVIIAERTAELKLREPELVQELDKLIDRIRTARQEYGAIENLYVSSNAALSSQKFVCEQCGNQVSKKRKMKIEGILSSLEIGFFSLFLLGFE